jgi:AcrR family transcriptional regulator
MDPRLIDATGAAIARWGLPETTLNRIAAEADMSRATFYRRGVTRDQLITALAEKAAETFRTALWPATDGTDNAAERLRAALEAMCATADRHLQLLAGMFLARGEVFDRPRPLALTVDVFAEPFQRLLREGAADGTLRKLPPTMTATVLFNTVGLGYVHLRTEHRWDAETARRSVIDLVLPGLVLS